METQHDVTIKNWDGTWTYRPRVKVTPESVDDLVEIVTDAVRFPTPVRPAGSMHSTSRMNGDDEGGTMVNMKAMNRILHFTDDTATVAAAAGAFEAMRSLPGHVRSRILREIAQGIEARGEQLAGMIARPVSGERPGQPSSSGITPLTVSSPAPLSPGAPPRS